MYACEQDVTQNLRHNNEESLGIALAMWQRELSVDLFFTSFFFFYFKAAVLLKEATGKELEMCAIPVLV